jgi:hypothetical protein
MSIQNWVEATAPSVRQAQLGILANNQTATGTNQATAFLIPTDFVVFTTVASGTGCKILAGSDSATGVSGPCLPADIVIIVNHGANPLTVYPQVGGKIANGSANAGFSIGANKTASFTYLGSDTWAASLSA